MNQPASEARLLVDRDGDVLVLTISNPLVRNAMNPSIYRSGLAAMRSAAADATIAAVVLTGDGAHFCGGGDLRRLQAQRSLPRSEQLAHLDALRDWVESMRELPRPVIAAVEGVAAGGGFSVCLGCDLIVAADDARFVMSYVGVALSPDGGASSGLADALPPQAALELLLDGQPMEAKKLHGWGIVNRLVPAGQARAQALAWAQRLAQGPREAQADIKRLLYAARGRNRRAQFDDERDTFVRNLYGDACGDAMDRFLQRRERPRKS